MHPLRITPVEDSRPAPELRVAQWFGPPTSLQALRGRVVVLHAFQMLCPGCVLHGIPQAARIHHAFDPADVAVIGLHSVFEHHDAMGPISLAAFLHEFRVPFPVAVDARAAGARLPQTMSAYDLQGTPSLVMIDRGGQVRASLFGRPEDLVVGAAVASLAAERAATTHPIPHADAPATCSTEGCPVPSPPG